MYNHLKNVRIYAEPNCFRTGMNVYLDFSGQQAYLMSHRNNAPLLDLLASGMRLEELERFTRTNSRRESQQKLRASAKHILRSADEYIRYEHLELPVLMTEMTGSSAA